MKSVHASCQGMGHAGLQKFAAHLDLPKPVSAKPYSHLVNALRDTSVILSEKVMNDAAKQLIEITESKNPENIVYINGEKLAKVAVTVDGTWQRRGHNSKIGVVFIISVITGKVLDAVVKSLYCHQCVTHSALYGGDSNHYNAWYQNHKTSCDINHVGSSGVMETNGAMQMFLQSMERRHLMYTIFVGDGDSDCFGKVSEECAKLNIGYDLTKEECVGHVQKRLGTALREFKRKRRGMKLADGKTVGGKNRLTDNIIDKMQNVYGEAIRGNSGDLESMKNAIWAIFYHIIQSDLLLSEQHTYCPHNGWCKFWTNKESYTVNNRLPNVFAKELKPIFIRLTKDELLNRCLRGLTQNQNEAVNGVLWSRCPKTKFCSKTKVELAVSETICHFNAGSVEDASLHIEYGSNVSANMLQSLQFIDKERIRHAAKKICEKARLVRRKKRSKSKSKLESKSISYMSGAFGTGRKPEIDLDENMDLNVENPVIDILFIDEKDIQMIEKVLYIN